MTTLDVLLLILSGLPITVIVSVGGFIFAVLVGTVGGSTMVWGGRISRAFVRSYVELFRGTSIYFQLFYIYFVLPFWGITMPPILAGIVALGLNAAAYFSQTVRGSILAVPRDQTEAAIALNLTLGQRIRRIILPQALPIAMPPMGNMAVEILKGSALVSLIALHDITYQAMVLRPHLGSIVTPLLSLLVIYYAIAKVIDVTFRSFEKRLARGLETGRK